MVDWPRVVATDKGLVTSRVSFRDRANRTAARLHVGDEEKRESKVTSSLRPKRGTGLF